MEIKVGQKVLVKHQNFKGVVVKIQKDNIFVQDEHGFDFPFQLTDLILINQEQDELSKYTKAFDQMLLAKKSMVNLPKKSFKKSKQEKYGVVIEVDLHIEKLVKSYKHLQNIDILNIQLATAKHKVEFAIQKRIPKLVLIHGVGEGVLKEELKYLLNKYEVNIQEASYVKYGLGAMEVTVL